MRRVNALARQLSGAACSSATSSLIGRPVEEMDTPALYVELDALEANIRTVAQLCTKNGALWRPHMKAIRTPEIALKMVEAGACGVTCAKVSQAAVLVNGGVKDVLIANEVVGKQKIEALVQMAKKADRVCVACDDPENMRQISAAAGGAQVTVGVLVDVEAGMRRCGIPWEQPDEIAALCRLAGELPHIEYRGLMAYDGNAQAFDKKVERTTKTGDAVFSVKAALEKAGVAVPLVSGSGSGNYYVATKLGSITEVQAGGGIFCCDTYQNYNKIEIAPPMRTAMYLQAQIISSAGAQKSKQLIGDAGFKSGFPMGGAVPTVVSHPALKVKALNAEHTVFGFEADVPQQALPKLGEIVTMVPVYSDATTLLHQKLYGVRGGKVEAVYELDAIGQLQ